jgi:cytochrome c oxidase assembly protein subunit 15
LSIVEWQPIIGTLPPLSQADWQETFGKYQLTPQYLQVNKGMTLDEFKGIFWWEYWHRLLGRLIGIAVLVPLLWFIARRELPPGPNRKAVRHIPVGRVAGRIGLVHGEKRPRRRSACLAVRLTAHLGLALAIFARCSGSGFRAVRRRGGAC